MTASKPNLGRKKQSARTNLVWSENEAVTSQANHSPLYLWIFEWVTKSSSGNCKQLWQLKLPGNQESARTTMQMRPPIPWPLLLPWVSGATESAIFYSNISYKMSDLSLQFQKPISPKSQVLFLNSLKCNDFQQSLQGKRMVMFFQTLKYWCCYCFHS